MSTVIAGDDSDSALISIGAIVNRLNNVLILPTHTVVGATQEKVVLRGDGDNSDEDYDDDEPRDERMHRLFFSAPGNVNSRPFLAVQHSTIKIPNDEILKGLTAFHRSYDGLERILRIYKLSWEGIARRTAEASMYKTQSQEYLDTVTTRIVECHPHGNPANGGLKISASKPNSCIISITLNQIKEAEIMYLMDALAPFFCLPTTHIHDSKD